MTNRRAREECEDELMKSAIIRIASAIAVVAGACASAPAHHSHAMFDQTKEVTIVGTVKAFNFANPHVYLFVDVKNPDGTVTTWPIEMSTIRNMVSRGITATTFRYGDTVAVTFNPLRDGASGGSYTLVIDAAGREYK